MEYKKTIILLILAIFLVSLSGVCASEIDDTIASDDTDAIALSTDNDIAKDNLQTTQENIDHEVVSAQTDNDILSDNPGNYSGLAGEIGSGGNIELQHDYYAYDGSTDTIEITVAGSVIDGRGAVIDMAGSAIQAFKVSASDVTIKNLSIKNANYDGKGGAIFFDQAGTVTDCNFTDNKAVGE